MGVNGFKGFNTNQSPYHIDRTSKKEKMSFYIEKDAVEDLKKHFKSTIDINEKNKVFSEGMRRLCHKELDNLCLERKTFNNLQCFMLIPKTEDIDELDNKSQIIAFVNTESDLQDFYNYKNDFNSDYNISYNLMEFDKKYFHQEMKLLQNTKDSCVYRTPRDDLNSFYTFKDSQRELYDLEPLFKLDVDDCYFVRFPLNNYLDTFFEGQYQHKEFKQNHLGVYVLHNVMKDLRLYLLVNFYYLSEYERSIRIDFQFITDTHMMQLIMDTGDEKLIDEMNNSISDKLKKERLLHFKSLYEKNLELVNNFLDKIDD